MEEVDSDLATQAIDMIFKNDAFNEKFVRPLKKKTYPYILSGIAFNLVLLVLLCLVTFNMYAMNRKLHGIISRLE
jgi:hypothetical protein